MLSDQIKDVIDQVEAVSEGDELSETERELMGYALRSLGLAYSLVNAANALRMRGLMNGD